MSSGSPGGLAGTVRWAVVPYAPRPPFRLYAGENHAPVTVPDATKIIAAARRGDAEFTYLVPGKARPVLLLTEPPTEQHREVTALRLLRLSKLDTADREHVREGSDPLLFRLDPSRFDLPEESAAMVSGLVRIHVDAIDVESRGELTPNEMRVLGEQLIEFYGFDTRLLVERRTRELAARRHEGEQP